MTQDEKPNRWTEVLGWGLAPEAGPDEEEDRSPGESERSVRLLSLLENSRQNHDGLTRSGVQGAMAILDAMDELIRLVQEHKIAIADGNSSGSLWGRKSILEHIGKLFDPPLKELIPYGKLAWATLDRHGTGLPLAPHLQSKDSCLRIANSLKMAAQVLEEYFNPSTDDWKLVVCWSEGLHAVAEIMEALYIVLPKVRLRWCHSCFRRTHGNNKYCSLHTPGRSTAQDTSHRKGKKLHAALPTEIVQFWKSYRATRSTLGESVQPISCANDLSTTLPVDARIITVHTEVHQLVTCTEKLKWQRASAHWEILLSSDFPAASCLLHRRPAEFQDWNGFAGHILAALEDTHEQTRHPLWILNILACAEDWLTAELTNADKRKTGTPDEIEAIFRSGIIDPREIADLVGKSRQYVYRIIRTRKLGQ
jgi:hypothetical protein